MLGGNGRARNRLFLAFRFFWPLVRLHFGRPSEVAPVSVLLAAIPDLIRRHVALLSPSRALVIYLELRLGFGVKDSCNDFGSARVSYQAGRQKHTLVSLNVFNTPYQMFVCQGETATENGCVTYYVYPSCKDVGSL